MIAFSHLTFSYAFQIDDNCLPDPDKLGFSAVIIISVL